MLQVDSAKAKTRLRWRPIWNEVSSADELTAYVADAVTSDLGWAIA
jgi:CDP-glucose 4,6-dehydratase